MRKFNSKNHFISLTNEGFSNFRNMTSLSSPTTGMKPQPTRTTHVGSPFRYRETVKRLISSTDFGLLPAMATQNIDEVVPSTSMPAIAQWEIELYITRTEIFS
jgi:hypothetical protein